MAMMSGGSINFNKLAGDTDFDALVNDLYKIESRPVNQLIRWRSEWTSRLDAFALIRTELANLRTSLNSLNSVDKFFIKNSASSKPEFATATCTSAALESTYKVKVDQLASNSVWSMETGLSNKNAVVNDTGSIGEFVFNYKGKEHTVQVPPGTTLQGLTNLINNNSTYKGVKANIIQGSSGAIFQLSGTETGEAASLYIQRTTNIPSMPVTLQSATWDLTGQTATFKSAFPDSNTTPINAGPGDKTFVYSFDGAQHTVNISDTDTLDDLIAKINIATPGVASYEQSGSDFFLKLDAGTEILPPKHINTNLQDMLDSPNINPTAVITASDTDKKTYSVTIGTELVAITMSADHTIQDIMMALNAKKPGVLFTDFDGTNTTLHVKDDFQRIRSIMPTSQGSFDELDFVAPTTPGWIIQNGENAKIRINNIPADPHWLEVSSNSVSDVVEGITFNLAGEGETIISVSVDGNSMMENIQNFVDATNKVRMMINELSTVDPSKPTVDLEYAESQFDMQKGSILTGNYGVQMISSMLKQLTASTGLGFIHGLYEGSDNAKVLVHGDIFASLSQIGITTNAQEGNPMYGLLEIKLYDDGRAGANLMDAIEKNPASVAELFAAKSQGKSHSYAFGHASHVSGITKPGIYDISYDIENLSGIDTPTNILINGKAGKYMPDTKQIMLAESGDSANGLVLDIFDWSLGRKQGEVSIRDGKVNELIGMLDGESGMLNSNKGVLGILERNYKKIAENIDLKITREDERLKNWSIRTRQRFARLEENLAYYNNLQEGLKTQLNQLNTKS